MHVQCMCISASLFSMFKGVPRCCQHTLVHVQYIKWMLMHNGVYSLVLKVVELANLDRLQTPLEKLYCLKSTIVSILSGTNHDFDL